MVEALRGDSARQKRLMELLAARLELDAQVADLLSDATGAVHDAARMIGLKERSCAAPFTMPACRTAWTEDRAKLWSVSLEKFVDWFIQPDLPLADCHREWIYLVCLFQFLVLLAPRGHGNSTVFGCWFPLWKIYMDANATIMLVASSASISETELRTVRQHIETNTQLEMGFGALGPPSALRWTQSELIVDRPKRTLKDPTLTATGQGSEILGRHVSNGFILCDDLVDDMNVSNPEGRTRLLEWLKGTLLPVLEPDQQLIVVGTRKHWDDLYGHLMELTQFHSATYRAIEENADGSKAVIWPAKYSLDALNKLNQTMGSILFDREFRNDILSDANSYFPFKWFKGEGATRGCFAYDEHILDHHYGSDLRKVIAVDPAISQVEGSSYFVAMTLGLDERGDFHLLNLFRAHLDFPEQIRVVARLCDQFLPSAVVIEDNGFQVALVQALKELHHQVPVISHRTTQQKHDPNQGIPLLSSFIEQGRIRFPMGDPESEKTSMVVVDELNKLGRGKHDDCVVTLWMDVSQLLREPSPGEVRATVIRSSLLDNTDGETNWRRRWPRDPGGTIVGGGSLWG